MTETPEGLEPQPEKPRGRNTVLWVLAIGGGLAVLLCGGCLVGVFYFISRGVSEDPATVRATAQSISEIEVPEGYEPLISLEFWGIKMARFGKPGAGDIPSIMLMSFPPAMADEQQMRDQARPQIQEQTGVEVAERLESEQRTYTIRGEETEVQFAKVEDEQGRQLREVTAVFAGKEDAPAMLMVIMSEEQWTERGEESVDAMLQSMQ